MAYMQKPGRGNNPKTGHGLPTPLRQEIELTKKYDKGKELQKKQRESGNTPSGMKVESKSGMATPNLPMHSVVKSGTYVRELDSKGGVVKEERMDSKGNEKFYKSVADRNSDVTKRQTRNAMQYNATSGGTAPDKLSSTQKNVLVGLGKAKKAKA